MSPPLWANNAHVYKKHVLLLAFLRVKGRHAKTLCSV